MKNSKWNRNKKDIQNVGKKKISLKNLLHNKKEIEIDLFWGNKIMLKKKSKKYKNTFEDNLI